MPVKVSGWRRMHMCLRTHAETQRQNTPTNEWAMKWEGCVWLTVMKDFLLLGLFLYLFSNLKLYQNEKLKYNGYWHQDAGIPHCECNEWILLGGCFVWLITIKIMITSTHVTRLTTACNFNPREAGTTGLHRHLHLWAHLHVQVHTGRHNLK